MYPQLNFLLGRFSTHMAIIPPPNARERIVEGKLEWKETVILEEGKMAEEQGTLFHQVT